jgi:predicted enzyme related to lactoylglutathione lyase
MQKTANALANKPAWIDLATSDMEASRDFYSKLFGWEMDVSDDPQYGGYAEARLGDRTVAGIGGKQDQNAPTAWSLYIGTDDAEAIGRDVASAGGTVVAPAFDIGPLGRMAVFQDPSGAFINAWQTAGVSKFLTEGANAYGWAELNARGVENAIPFYETVFGWTHKTSPMGEDQPPYTEFQLDGQSIAGAWEMNPMVPAEVPAYWLVYISVDDVDATFKKAIDMGSRELVAAQDFPGGRFAILMDPQGASFGILKSRPRADR